jgi:hypothetical protein
MILVPPFHIFTVLSAEAKTTPPIEAEGRDPLVSHCNGVYCFMGSLQRHEQYLLMPRFTQPLKVIPRIVVIGVEL